MTLAEPEMSAPILSFQYPFPRFNPRLGHCFELPHCLLLSLRRRCKVVYINCKRPRNLFQSSQCGDVKPSFQADNARQCNTGFLSQLFPGPPLPLTGLSNPLSNSPARILLESSKTISP